MENIISEKHKELELKDYKKTKTLALYLVSLFYKSGEIYYCSRPKINRLLTVYKLCSAGYDPDCFHFSFVPGTSSGLMGIKDLSDYIERDCYLFIKGTEDKQEFFEDFDESVEMPSRYVDEYLDYEINDEEKELLEIIFRKFASYPINELAKLLDQMKNNLPFRKKIDAVNYIYFDLDSDEFLEFLNSKENNERYKDNEIFKFIKDFNNIVLETGTINKNDYLSVTKIKVKK